MPIDYSKAYIYKIINNLNNEIYVGCSTNTAYIRLGFYRKNAIKGNTGTLYDMMRKLGNENFKIIQVEKCKQDIDSKLLLNARSDHWRNELNATLTVHRLPSVKKVKTPDSLTILSSDSSSSQDSPPPPSPSTLYTTSIDDIPSPQ